LDHVAENVGRQLRRLRRSRGLTLAELAARAGCTSGYLSSVENGSTTPTLSSISTLAAVLGSDMSGFFAPAEAERVHVHRAKDQQRLRIAPRANQTYTILSATKLEPSFTGLIEELVQPTDDTSYSYLGERFMLVLDGEVELRVAAETYKLGPGDTIHYSSHPDHYLCVTSEEPAHMFWIVTPALL